MKPIVFFLLCISISAQAGECSPGKPEPFNSFVQRFAYEPEFAIRRTVFPLRILKWQYGMDENGKDVSAPERWQITQADFAGWPSLASAMQENGLASRIAVKTGTRAVLEVFRPNTDWLLQFHFRIRNGCWLFWQYEDRSLD
jgi:hypothetical protein